jgi:hypothetical protein
MAGYCDSFVDYVDPYLIDDFLFGTLCKIEGVKIPEIIRDDYEIGLQTQKKELGEIETFLHLLNSQVTLFGMRAQSVSYITLKDAKQPILFTRPLSLPRLFVCRGRTWGLSADTDSFERIRSEIISSSCGFT